MQDFPESIKRVLITGGAGFIGGTLAKRLLKETELEITIIDKLGYASSLKPIHQVINKYSIPLERYKFLKIDIVNHEQIKAAIESTKPNIIFHLAAESHVDRSIEGPRVFLESNIIGTFNLLEAAKNYWENITPTEKNNFKLIHISTDEVFGSVEGNDLFTEKSNYKPTSPYSASKAASDHLIKAWHHTYKLPTIITNSSNNYGPWQFPEKLIPIIINNAVTSKEIPIYGDGKNIRDWIYVEDHIEALITVSQKGKIGDSYCIGTGEQRNNDEVVEIICNLLDIFFG